MTDRNQDFTYDAGDDLDLVVTVRDAVAGGGSPINLTGATIYWWLLDSPESTAPLVTKSTVGGGVAITDAGAGEFTVTLDPADVAALNGRYVHKAKVKDSAGDEVTVTTGDVVIHPKGPSIP